MLSHEKKAGGQVGNGFENLEAEEPQPESVGKGKNSRVKKGNWRRKSSVLLMGVEPDGVIGVRSVDWGRGRGKPWRSRRMESQEDPKQRRFRRVQPPLKVWETTRISSQKRFDLKGGVITSIV